jgi:hypothetical protein
MLAMALGGWVPIRACQPTIEDTNSLQANPPCGCMGAASVFQSYPRGEREYVPRKSHIRSEGS